MPRDLIRTNSFGDVLKHLFTEGFHDESNDETNNAVEEFKD